jgi:DNA repair exonuclease SbcCD ATPase subunit
MSTRLTFHTIRYKNFMGVGNQWVELPLDQNAKTIIYGKNGAGKSTMYEALYFCLFNKAFRKINKPDLVNNINNKALEVEVTLTASGKQFRIRRGIKPNIFEIHDEDGLIDQTSKTGDYQTFLEHNILRIGPKNAGQTMILGSKLYIPFMKLGAGDRRSLVEEILDIQIFSHMNTVAKDQKKSVLLSIEENQRETELTVNSLDHIKEAIETFAVRNATLKTQYDGEVTEMAGKIAEWTARCDVTIANGLKKKGELDAIQDADLSGFKTDEEYRASIPDADMNPWQLPIPDVKTKAQEQLVYIKDNQKAFEIEIVKAQGIINSGATILQRDIAAVTADIEFYANNPVCPTCKQDIETAFHVHTTAGLNTKITTLTATFTAMEDANNKLIRDYQSGVDAAVEKSVELVDQIEEWDTTNDAMVLARAEANLVVENERTALVNKMTHEKAAKQVVVQEQRSVIEQAMAVLRTEVIAFKSNITSGNERITALNLMIDGLEGDDDIAKKRKEQKQLVGIHVIQTKDKESLTLDLSELEVVLSLLKDDGIKRNIIKAYIPVINKLIRKYLDILEFPVGFILDEEFKETISVPGRRDLSYGSFSAGEQMRIDLALLFTFREIPIIKGGNTTNLMIFDEIADSALDSEGWDAFFTIIESITDVSNVFVLSPKGDELTEKFNDAIRFFKSGSFTQMETL